MEKRENHVNIIAEIGINHNGDMDLCKKMIMLSKVAGCDYAKIQKRTPDLCVPENQKMKMRDTPWGQMTYIDYKKKIEFNEEEICELIEFSKSIGIEFFASVWDLPSVDLMSKYTKIGKIPSALINDIELCKYAREKFELLIISTGMSTEEEIEKVIEESKPDVVMHTCSTYPSPMEELNLQYITHLKNKWEGKDIGYSGHEFGLVSTFATVALGVKWIERHITMDREMWGSDHKASVEPIGLFKLVKGVRDLEKALYFPPQDRLLFESEKSKRDSLRK
jgi:N-acetylneuraminate synthase